MSLNVKFKKLHPDAVIPSYAQPGDAGLDLTAISENFKPSGEYERKGYHYIEYGTGLSVEIPEGYVGFLFPRSSISKTSLILANSIGVVDSGYRGEIMLRFKCTDLRTGKVYEVGDRIGQLIIMPYPKINIIEAEELSETERNTGGFGSSGN